MRQGHLIFLLVSLLTVARAAWAESENRLRFETIFDLPFVQSLEFAPGGEELFVAMDGQLLQWQLDPLRLTHHRPAQILANEMVLGPDDNLYFVGLGRARGSFGQAGSKAVAFARDKTEGAAFEAVDTNSNLGISQYSSIAFDSAGNAILASASSYSASPFPRKADLRTDGKRTYPQLRFRCGGVSQLSIFAIDGVDHYLASTAGQATLEFGRLNLGPDQDAGGDCFMVEQMEKGQTRKPTFDAVRHAVIDLGDTPFAVDGARKAIMVLDPNSNRLFLFRIEPFGDRHFLSRIGALEIDLRKYMPPAMQDAVLTDLATDALGREVHVSSNSASVVLRFAFDGTGLVHRGRIATNAPVQRLKMSRDGTAAAVVTGQEPFGGDWRITVIDNPGGLSDWLQIPASFPSVRLIQEQLNARALSAGSPDGILGPQTRAAMAEFLAGEGAVSPEAEKPDAEALALYRSIVSSFPKYLASHREKLAAAD
ncbi:hypothetical protein BOO69_15185 [Sulfitobacter alexandrii]|uniref:Peptidoglycan binding-like domain-containing protein n=1 Tax=Sulfitobacter alexandrii TaxID=1917485 RepID=A0A1J0WKC7_9RHOB|nr:peptidoglycan-binding domain-containing protein [Sulfitobacter alexandrii]APE44606.1 hypothetical protein BOO69_15185 [Sulfitobacter alexandrii]